MIKRRNLILGGTALVALGACSDSKFKRYRGPEVTYVVVNKAARNMYLLHHDKVLEAYDIKLGFAPEGHKEIEGDGRTPEGVYWIDRRNPNSRFHLSLGISYPNDWTWGCISVTNKEMEQIYAVVGDMTPIQINA